MVVGYAHQPTPQPAHEDGKGYQQRQGQGDRHQARQHQVMHRADVHRAQRVNLLVNPHRADLGRHRGANPPGNQDCHSLREAGRCV